jgi:hypothetical protein
MVDVAIAFSLTKKVPTRTLCEFALPVPTASEAGAVLADRFWFRGAFLTSDNPMATALA